MKIKSKTAAAQVVFKPDFQLTEEAQEACILCGIDPHDLTQPLLNSKD